MKCNFFGNPVAPETFVVHNFLATIFNLFKEVITVKIAMPHRMKPTK